MEKIRAGPWGVLEERRAKVQSLLIIGSKGSQSDSASPQLVIPIATPPKQSPLLPLHLPTTRPQSEEADTPPEYRMRIDLGASAPLGILLGPFGTEAEFA